MPLFDPNHEKRQEQQLTDFICRFARDEKLSQEQLNELLSRAESHVYDLYHSDAVIK
ncbi:hypothetical protein [Alkalibacillus almallahensis]|uniref:hypothetical protein n=1 Tax=Alkalibacillus almallahensis TaxID=1379154 RepID=UPI0014240246|nr:hypothetical protein [Alkalibacillus almallahensis]NIK10881.1 hypothetical protein [Alkalibacillus almallahensis]